MAPDLAFGPKGDQWYYTRSTNTYDLTRGVDKKLTISTTKGPPGTKLELAPALTALVVVDMQNFFLAAKCRSHPTGLAAVDPTLRVIEKCRNVGVQLVWLNWGLTDDDLAKMPAAVQHGFSRSLIQPPDQNTVKKTGLGSDLGNGQGRTLMAGEWNSAIYPPLAAVVKAEDTHCGKNRMSGLWNSEQPLWKYLEESGKKTLLFAGVNTDQCVLGTLADAYNSGWDCVMVEDCCATTTGDAQGVCLHNVSSSYGFVVDSNAIAAGKVG
ncbi:isochorismatase [Pseudomassariella vexata]|uniref:Isochorismatase n=1 Tax=Pseudomassariella vexata TaxID=1141098 RepID=A0A1Y2D859_9PEZI|nr:isochorismatase [Pseudomassariella vexata]ORY55450.1 isochorismatase [Pseudomassariella vexata]